MHRIAIVRKGQQPERRIGNAQDIEDAVYEVLSTEKAATTENDLVAIRGLIGQAVAMCETEGFAALKFGNSAVTIRPAPPQPEDDPAN
ncbi:hypothetical protein [Streptomyces sp. NPDC046862]|uniref:hypothetical protein n=1 Tax=Streptomyces sp. NPDC046862 TaxID=3154603 RepID=UPI003456D7C6